MLWMIQMRHLLLAHTGYSPAAMVIHFMQKSHLSAWKRDTALPLCYEAKRCLHTHPHCSWYAFQAGSGMLERQAAGFLGSCLPSGAMLGGSLGLKGAGGAAMHKLAAQGLGWAPTVGNLCTLLCFVLALALNAQLNEVS